jgi:hypothetical protein
VIEVQLLGGSMIAIVHHAWRSTTLTQEPSVPMLADVKREPAQRSEF